MAALNFHHLRLFHAIAREGGLTRAAARLNLSQSALSTQLRALETQLGHALFLRQGRTMILTEAGRIALEAAESVFQTGEELLGTLRGRPPDRHQTLRVGAAATLSRNFQTAFLRPLLGRPDVALVLRSGTLRELLAQLESRTLDVVLANAPVRRDAHMTLHSHLIDRQPVSLVSRPPAAAFRLPKDLDGTPVLVPSLDSEIRGAFERLTAAAGVRPLILAEVDDMAMLRLLARESGTMALVPTIVVRDELAGGALVERCRLPGIFEDFYAITQSRRFPNPLVAELVGAS